MRTPGYIKGKIGIVERVQGSFRNPETLAYGGDGLPMQALYLVSFEQTTLWPEYRATRGDKLLVDVYEHWLERESNDGPR